MHGKFAMFRATFLAIARSIALEYSKKIEKTFWGGGGGNAAPASPKCFFYFLA